MAESFEEKVKQLLDDKVFDVFAVSGLEDFKGVYPCIPPDLLDPYTKAISIGIHLDDAILDEIKDHPTNDYEALYNAVNARLDEATAAIVTEITTVLGYKALAIPATREPDPERMMGSISHKAIARHAGIGFIGKSGLIVHPSFGPRLRLATVITDLPLEENSPAMRACGTCTACIDACPAGAIHDIEPEAGTADWEYSVDLEKCCTKLIEFRETFGIGHSICGICVKVCPWGK
jgi:epoxyqueuosine reductase QueG